MTTSTELTVSQKTQKAIDQIRSPEISLGLEEALPENVSLRQFQRAAITALMDNPNLVNADRTSLIQALTKSAQDGLLLDGRDAAGVIYKTKIKDGDKERWIEKVQYLPMIGGLRRIAAEHGISIHASVVYKNDELDPDLENHKVNHKPTRLGEDRGPIIGAYAIAQHKDGRRFGPKIMDMEDIQRVRAKSKAKDGEAWKNWFDRMAEKTVARRLFKELPFDSKDRERIQRLVAADEDPVNAVYGNEFSEPSEPAPDEADEPQVEDADWSESAEDAPFEGEEPPEVIAEASSEGTATFGAGRYENMTVAEVYALGEEGVSYIKWAITGWKTGDIVADLKAFAETHPEVTS